MRRTVSGARHACLAWKHLLTRLANPATATFFPAFLFSDFAHVPPAPVDPLQFTSSNFKCIKIPLTNPLVLSDFVPVCFNRNFPNPIHPTISMKLRLIVVLSGLSLAQPAVAQQALAPATTNTDDSIVQLGACSAALSLAID